MKDPHNRRPPCDLPGRSSSQDPKLCHKRSFRDHASDWSFPHVQWQPLVSEHNVSALRWQTESFHRAGIQLTHELHGQERVLAMLHCRTHRCRFRLPLSSMQAERRKNSWRSHQQDFIEPSRACRCSSSCSPSFWHKSPGLMYSMRKSNYHLYSLISSLNSCPSSPGVKVANLLHVVLLWSLHWQSSIFQVTFFLFFTSWNCSVASAICDASSIFSIFLVLRNWANRPGHLPSPLLSPSFAF